MSLHSRLSAASSSWSMAVPARISLWLGLVLVLTGYNRQIGVFMVVGTLLIITGSVLWFIFKPKTVPWKFLKKIPGVAIFSRYGDARASKKEAADESWRRAQDDPRFKAKRKHQDRLKP